MATLRPPFRVRRGGGGGDFTPVDLAPTMTEAGIKEAVGALLGLAVGTFGILSAEDQRGSGLHAGLEGDWDVVLLPVAPAGAAGACRAWGWLLIRVHVVAGRA